MCISGLSMNYTSLEKESSGAARSFSRMARVRSRHMLRCKAVFNLISFICFCEQLCQSHCFSRGI